MKENSNFLDSKKAIIKNKELDSGIKNFGEKSDLENIMPKSPLLRLFYQHMNEDVDSFVASWKTDFQENLTDLTDLKEKDKLFLEFHFCCNHIVKGSANEGRWNEMKSPFVSDDQSAKDFLQELKPSLQDRVVLVRRFLRSNQGGVHELMISNFCDKYVRSVIGVFKPNNTINIEDINNFRFKKKGYFSNFAMLRKEKLGRLAELDFTIKRFYIAYLPEREEKFSSSILKYRTFLFRFIPTFIYNIFDLKRFLKGFYTYSNDGRYRLSFHKVPLILGKTSPLFFSIFQFDVFLNFPLGVVLSCLDFCSYSILRGNLNENEIKRLSLFQRFFLVWRPFVSECVNVRDFGEEECHNAFASVILKVLTNFVGINFNIKVKGDYFFSINLMSFVDDFILREYFLDSFNYSNKDLNPSSWSLLYVLDKGRIG